MEKTKTLTVDQSIKILHQVARLAQSKGILSMEDSVLTLEAMKITSSLLEDTEKVKK